MEEATKRERERRHAAEERMQAIEEEIANLRRERERCHVAEEDAKRELERTWAIEEEEIAKLWRELEATRN